MFTINMAERFNEDDLETLRNDIASLVRFWAESAYGEAMVRTAGPDRMVHLEQRMANDDHLPALVGEGARGDERAGARVTPGRTDVVLDGRPRWTDRRRVGCS